MKLIPLLILCLMLSGCADGVFPVSDKLLEEAGDAAMYTKDASVAKEHEVHKTLRNRDKMIKDAHDEQGLKLDWKEVKETVFYPGMKEPIVVTRTMPTITYKERAEFRQPLPTEPSKHPVWKFAENFGANVVTGLVAWTGITEAGKTARASINNAGDKYYGDYNRDSFNQTAEPFVVQPEVIYAPQ